ncbi:hypothetical protein [Sporichthya sp.]|uniref:hypothetical protein n=1 Tax=Sporichthya sp. TaxID=65475 RepID=UPI0018415C85|nr:hypothetical protein [Sporichthya sp.]MBA3744802.1 hypothetical protein [Sporichthya sp.]
MYVWMWRHLPGPWFVRLALSLMLALVAVYLLFEHAFPWLDPKLPFNQVEIEGGAGQ